MAQKPVSRSFRYWVPLIGIVVLGGLVLKSAIGPAITSRKLLADARAALQHAHYGEAERLACRIDRTDGLYPQGLLVAGEAAMRDERNDDAVKHYAAVVRDGSHSSVIAAFSLAELWRDMGHLSKAEREYAYVLQRQPNNIATHERMAFLMGVSGRRWEALPHFMFLMKSGGATFEELALLGDLDRPVEQPDYLQRCARNVPDDILVELGQAAQAVTDKRPADALPLLQRIVMRDHELVAAQALLGELLVDSDVKSFVTWHSQLSVSANEYPEIWFVRGLWARHRGHMQVAARCFWETVRRDPTHRRGNYQLGQVLAALNAPSAAEFAKRSSQFYELSRALDEVLRSHGQDERPVSRVTELMESTGRIWEACAWAALAAQKFPAADWARSTARRLSFQLSDDLPRTIRSANLPLKWDLSTYPSYPELLARVQSEVTTAIVNRNQSSIRFAEAIGVGFDFVYFNAVDPETAGARMFEQTGGGVAVLDVDGDDFPDLYLTQGTEWPTGAIQPKPTGALTDRLFRNVGGASFVDITIQAGLVESGFGQGCAAGDFDNDGFADLYIANIGQNQLYRNNGDGTFSDVTASSGLREREWTASCAIVDLNADGMPDLFSVNYLTGEDIFTTICKGKACSPKVFEGVPDRVHINRGDGAFELIPDATPEAGSKGLGIVAFTLHRRDRPNLFIANDQTPNFLLHNLPSTDRFNLRLENEGFISGLAFNQDGLAMASMGIAADDVNGDGRIDFYVTTFMDEAKILFLQDSSGLFVDATTMSGLGGPGLPFVGWGTQFLDADCDGHPDLVGVNGHVDDYRSDGGEYHMRSQFFRNTGGGRFAELRAPEAGEWFEQKRLGRGLARLDWNRDGRMDFVVSNIGDPASLVTNCSESVGRFLNVRLHATATARDAIGSVVGVATSRRRLSKQLVTGDGYMASNERLLQFGLGDCQSVDSLEVVWPSGNVSTVNSVPSNATVVLIEGRRRCILRGEGTSNELDVVTSSLPTK
jgi:tetratricopeptide (TPR) repeat protein